MTALARNGLWLVLLLLVLGVCFLPWDQVLQPTKRRSVTDFVSADPTVLAIEIFPPAQQNFSLGGNTEVGLIDDKLAVSTQLHPIRNPSTNFEMEGAGSGSKITVLLLGDAPPYAVEFQLTSALDQGNLPSTRQKLLFPPGKLTRARLFNLLDVQGFYGNPQQKRPQS